MSHIRQSVRCGRCSHPHYSEIMGRTDGESRCDRNDEEPTYFHRRVVGGLQPLGNVSDTPSRAGGIVNVFPVPTPWRPLRRIAPTVRFSKEWRGRWGTCVGLLPRGRGFGLWVARAWRFWASGADAQKDRASPGPSAAGRAAGALCGQLMRWRRHVLARALPGAPPQGRQCLGGASIHASSYLPNWLLLSFLLCTAAAVEFVRTRSPVRQRAPCLATGQA
jgi:hypothetical protein